MKRNDVLSAGIPEELVGIAINAVVSMPKDIRKTFILNGTLREVATDPSKFLNDPYMDDLSRAIIDNANQMKSITEFHRANGTPSFKIWGEHLIEPQAINQMYNAMRVPVVRKGALMGDSHLGYGVPIGSVLATENAVIPNAVGVDIGCRMRLSIFDVPMSTWNSRPPKGGVFRDAIKLNTRFGKGAAFKKPHTHAVLDDARWRDTKLLRDLQPIALQQLGTSGGGNHFVEFGVVELENDNGLGLAAGQYVGLLSHSGSRGPGARIAEFYHTLAASRLPQGFRDLTDLAWLTMDSEAGQEYWSAMNLMGDFASANHECIHESIRKFIGATLLAKVENHHNFAWYENGLYVHRKGATPAQNGVFGVIPGNMSDPAYIVTGKGNAESLDSASHGAGRRMSRSAAKKGLSIVEQMGYLTNNDVELISGGVDEYPGAYKDIREVMAHQNDLIDVRGKFYPKIVKMADDGSRDD